MGKNTIFEEFEKQVEGTKVSFENVAIEKMPFFNKIFKSAYSHSTVMRMMNYSYHQAITNISKLVEDKLREANEEVILAKCTADDANGALAKKEKELQEVKSNVEELLAEKFLAKDACSEYKDEISALTKSVDKLQSKNNRLQVKIDGLKTADKISCKEEKNRYSEDIRALELKISELNKRHKKEISDKLKECTDEFLKIIKKKDKQIEELTVKVSKATVPFNRAFDEHAIVNIKKMREKGISVKSIAKEYEVSTSTIYRMLNGETYN